MSDKYLLHLLLAQPYLNTWVAVIDHCECTPFALARAKKFQEMCQDSNLPISYSCRVVDSKGEFLLYYASHRWHKVTVIFSLIIGQIFTFYS